MATIIKKVKKGRPYYYAVESARVGGKPRIVWQKYLGTVEGMVARAEGAKPARPKEAVIFELGGVAALYGIAQRLGVLELINEVVPKRDQGPSVGHYMLTAAINRALAPCSKLAIADWYETTVLRRLWRFPASAFSSQRFWDHMDMVSEEAIEEIDERMLPRIREEFGLAADLLLYDTTNFFTFISTSNARADLAQRGHSKAKRGDLRQVGLALLITRDFQVPLAHRLYAGNVPDVTLFSEIARELLATRYRALGGESEGVTLVMDKGNVSDDAMEELAVAGTHFVAALAASRLPELMCAPEADFRDLAGMPGSRAAVAEVELWGRRVRVVVTHSESFFARQLHGLTQNLDRAERKLHDLERSLERRRGAGARGKKPTLAGTRARVREILAPQFMADLYRVEVTEEGGLPRLRYRLDQQALRGLTEGRLGRTLIATNRLDWSPEEVVGAYRSLTRIEDTFRKMKDTRFLSWQPAYHWTDQKLRVHGFYCVLALTLATLAHQVVRQAGLDLSLSALLKDLTAIREVAVIYPSGTLAHPKGHVTLSRMSPRQRKLAELLHVGEVAAGARG